MVNQINGRVEQTPSFVPVYHSYANKKTEYINANNIEAVHKNENAIVPEWKVFFKEMQENGSYAINEASISDDVAKQLNIIA